MSSDIILPSKSTGDVIPVVFPFQSQMQFGEVITNQVVQVQVFAGTDPNPSLMLDGVTTADGFNATQLIQGGLPGVIYRLICIVACTGGTVYTRAGNLAVLDDDGHF